MREQPQYYIKRLSASKDSADTPERLLSDFPHPYPSLRDLQREVIRSVMPSGGPKLPKRHITQNLAELVLTNPREGLLVVHVCFLAQALLAVASVPDSSCPYFQSNVHSKRSEMSHCWQLIGCKKRMEFLLPGTSVQTASTSQQLFTCHQHTTRISRDPCLASSGLIPGNLRARYEKHTGRTVIWEKPVFNHKSYFQHHTPSLSSHTMK